MERAVVGPQDFGITKHRVEVVANHALARAPGNHGRVGPADCVFGVEQGPAIGEPSEQFVVAKQPLHLFARRLTREEQPLKLKAGEELCSLGKRRGFRGPNGRRCEQRTERSWLPS